MADLEDVTLDGKPLQSLRVADLKAALEERGLSKSGQKNALVKRLKGALMLENLQRSSTSHVGLQPNSQIGEEMSQNSFIKQYLAKQQELLRQRLEREAREAYEVNDQDDHNDVNNSACSQQGQDAPPAVTDHFKPPGPSSGQAGSEGLSHRRREAAVSRPPTSGSVAQEQNDDAGDSDEDDSEDGEDDADDDDDDDWDSKNQGRLPRQPVRAPMVRERSAASCQPQQQHIPSLLSPQLRQPTPPPSPPPELSFPLPDTPKQSPPSPDEAAGGRSPSSSSSGSSSSGSRSSSPEPHDGHAERKPGPLTLLARKMESEGAFSGAEWRSHEKNRQDNCSSSVSFPNQVCPEGLVSSVLQSHAQGPLSVLKVTTESDAELQRERAPGLQRKQQRKLEQERAIEEERVRAEHQKALEKEQFEREQALEKEKALQMKFALEKEKREREMALAKEKEERKRALELEHQRALEREQEEQEQRKRDEQERAQALERERLEKEQAQKAERERLEREKALTQERLERERLEQERIEREKALQLERERIALEKALEDEKIERERIEHEKALEQEIIERERIQRNKALEQERIERERIEQEKALEQERIEQERIEQEKALEQARIERERIEREKALEQERIERERIEREKAIERERKEREKALEQERIERERKEREKALEQERIERERKEREKALEQERIERERREREKSLEQERIERERREREKALEQERIERERREREKALEQERIERERVEREKTLEQERIEREKALEKERIERERKEQEKALEQERIERERKEREKALEQERIERERKEREKALEQERIEREGKEREKALEQERIERERKEQEKALEQERIERERKEREKALEQERIERERNEREKALEQERIEREKAQEDERLERERKELGDERERLKKVEHEKLEQEKMQKETQAIEEEGKKNDCTLELEKKRLASGVTEVEKGGHFSPSRKINTVLPTPTPFSTGTPTEAERKCKGEIHGPVTCESQPEESKKSPPSLFKKFRFTRNTPLQPHAGSRVIKRPRTFSDNPQYTANVVFDSNAESELQKDTSADFDALERVASMITQDESLNIIKEDSNLALDDKNETKNAVKGSIKTVIDSNVCPSSTLISSERGRDGTKLKKKDTRRSSSNESSSSESDSSSSRSTGSSSSSFVEKRTLLSQPHTGESLSLHVIEVSKGQEKNSPPQMEMTESAPLNKASVSQLNQAPIQDDSQGRHGSDHEKEKPERSQGEHAVSVPEKGAEGNNETPKAFSTRKISLSSSKSSPGSTENEHELGSAGGRKRRWGSSTAVTAKKPSISITTDSLKSLIPDIKPALNQEIMDLDAEDPVLSETDDEDKDHADQDLQICRTVTQIVNVENKENGEKETKGLEELEEDVQDETETKTYDEDPTLQAIQAHSPLCTPHEEVNTVTPRDNNIRRSISQQKMGVSITIDDPVRTARQPSPPRGDVSNIVHVCNLVRPFTLGQLKELLSRTGTLVEDGFWIDKIKSHCYVTYSTSEEAVATRQALHGVKWPQSNPKVLRVDFCQQDELDFHKGLNSAEGPRVGVFSHGQSLHPLLPVRDQWAEREREMGRREQARADREWDRDKIREFGKTPEEREAGAHRSRSRERRRKDREKSKEMKAEKKDKTEDPPAKMLDDLFRKTKAVPCIYWLPLTEEQYLQRETARIERRKEREQQRKREEEEAELKKKEENKERMRAGGGITVDRSEADKDKIRDRERARDRGRERDREADKRKEGYRRPGGYAPPSGRRSRSRSDPRERRR